MDWDFPLRLVLTHLQFSSDEPELFPDFIDRLAIPWTVLLISVSGKVVLIGTKECSESYEALENIYSILKGLKNNNFWLYHSTFYNAKVWVCA